MLSQTEVFARRVADYMGAAPVHCHATTPCHEMVRQMRDAGVSSAIIETETRSLAGIVTEQDVCRRMAFSIDPLTPVGDVMTHPVLTIRDDDHLYVGIANMRRHRLRHMPVIGASGEVVGVLNLDHSLAAAAHRQIDDVIVQGPKGR